MKFVRNNKFDLCYYGQVNSLRLNSNVTSKWASKNLWGTIYFAGDGTYPYLIAFLYKHQNNIHAVLRDVKSVNLNYFPIFYLVY